MNISNVSVGTGGREDAGKYRYIINRGFTLKTLSLFQYLYLPA